MAKSAQVGDDAPEQNGLTVPLLADFQTVAELKQALQGVGAGAVG